MNRVFVYGTLRRGASNAHRMAGALLLGSGSVRGTLLRIDWYPALVLDAGAGEVRGELWLLGAGLLEALDRFEGCDPASGCGPEYRRVETEVVLDDGRRLSAWVWNWAGEPGRYPVIAGGDWLASG
jgi:gamma-glutamylcyclotransferase (GGCT)/AIG2-like uncharacterized protein YtfP